ncbi:uncharacterized protein [Apostichopus japonicus]|uniref:uncharacterized protein n=1 Tax=Stichopus japonicus TaxID=307972 RepID=UPI003AB32757
MGASGSSKSGNVDMNGPEAQLVKDIIHDKTVVVFGKTFCPSCRKVKGLLDELNAKYETVELDRRKDGSQMQAVLGKMTGASTVPRVFIMGECIGGWDDTEDLHRKGGLILKLQDANAIP